MIDDAPPPPSPPPPTPPPPPAPKVTLSLAPGTRRGYRKVTLKLGTGQSFTGHLNIASARGRERYVQDVQERFPGVDPEGLTAELELAAAEDDLDGNPADAPPPSREELQGEADEGTEAALAAMDREAVRQAETMLLRPDLINLVMTDIAALGVVGEQALAAAVYLGGTSRLLRKPLSAIVQGTSSSGKSYVLMRTGELFPPEGTLLATDITANALYYLPPGALLHRLVLAGERRRGDGDDRAEATRALREMIEAGELRKLVTVKSPDGSGMAARQVWQPGPIAFMESTTATNMFDEDANRCLLLGSDETPEQTRRVVLAQARAAAGAARDVGGILARHHALQRMLRRVEVRVPFAEAIAAPMPAARPEARRAMPQVLAMVRAVALLHQRQRAAGPLEHGDCIEAQVADYVVARRVLMGPLGRSLGGGLPEAVARFGERLTARYGGGEVFDSTRAAREDEVLNNKSKVNEYLGTLAGAGVVECVEAHRGARPAQWRVVGGVPPGGALWLPTAEALLEPRP